MEADVSWLIDQSHALNERGRLLLRQGAKLIGEAKLALDTADDLMDQAEALLLLGDPTQQ